MSIYLHPKVIRNIKNNIMWISLADEVKQLLGNSHMEYENAILMFSLENNLRYKGNLVQFIEKDEKRYYEKMIKYCNTHMMLFPYHLSDIYIRGLRLTPFIYYKKMLQDVMNSDKNYDSIPNFTALDILRLLGIGRNQFIDCMNQCRKNKRQSSYGALSHLLPKEPVLSTYEAWWDIKVGFVTCEDVSSLAAQPKVVLDGLIDADEAGPDTLPPSRDQKRKENAQVILGLYRRGLIYFDIPVDDNDIFVVPSLEGFVMNRLQGDNIESLLYSIFATLDPSLTVHHLSHNVLAQDLQTVKNGISLLNRLGLAVRLPQKLTSLSSNQDNVGGLKGAAQEIYLEEDDSFFSSKHSSFGGGEVQSPTEEESLNLTVEEELLFDGPEVERPSHHQHHHHLDLSLNKENETVLGKKVAFVFDSSLTAFLMMGNLSQGLKTHAITMFETGKLPWESLQDFLKLLEQVDIEACANEDIQIYAKRSQALKNTLIALVAMLDGSHLTGLDLLKCESFLPLNHYTCQRILDKYECVIYISPLAQSICPILNKSVATFGPSIPEMHTPWFTLFISNLLNDGPLSLLLVRGTKIITLPTFFKQYSLVQIQTWDHDPIVVPTDTSLIAINEALGHYPILLRPYPALETSDSHPFRAYHYKEPHQNRNYSDEFTPHLGTESSCESRIKNFAFPLDIQGEVDDGKGSFCDCHVSLKRLASLKYFERSFGFVKYVKLPKPRVSFLDKIRRIESSTPNDESKSCNGSELEIEPEAWYFYECQTGAPLSEPDLNAQVLTKIKSHDLLSPENLLNLKTADKELTHRFKQFIERCQSFLGDRREQVDGDQFTFPGKEEDKHKDFSYPRNDLLFYGDKVMAWKP